MSVKFLKVETALQRTVLLVVGAFCLVGVYFFAKWELANTITTKAAYKEVAEAAVQMAPSDPQARYVWAGLLEKTFLPEDLPRSVAEYEQAAALSPHNFLMWLALGKARGRSGDQAGAETALRKAQELAPDYAQIQWTLGNVLLRENKTDEGFSQLRRAAAGDANYTNPVVLAAWQNFDGDLAKVRQSVGDSPPVNSALAVFLAKQKRFDEALQVWNSLPADGRNTDFKANGQELYNQFAAAKKFNQAQRLAAQINDPKTNEFAAGQFYNGGFETDVKMQNAGLFEWQIADAAQPQIGYDTGQKHGGERSLALVFNSTDGRDFRAVSQIVTVEAGKNYELTLFYKSDLKTTANFVWEIADAADGKPLAATQPTEAKIADWTKLSAKFTANAAEAVNVRLSRVPCKNGICPTTGRILFDDFALVKLD